MNLRPTSAQHIQLSEKSHTPIQKECTRFEEEVIAGGPRILPGVAELLAQVQSMGPLFDDYACG